MNRLRSLVLVAVVVTGATSLATRHTPIDESFEVGKGEPLVIVAPVRELGSSSDPSAPSPSTDLALPPLPLGPDGIVAVAVNGEGVPMLGDWNGDGFDEPAVWFPNGERGALRLPDGTIIAAAGSAAGVPLVGDWDGDGIDSVVTWDGAIAAGTIVVAGDWNGDGRDLVIVVPDPVADADVIVGDWDGDGIDAIATIELVDSTRVRVQVEASTDANPIELDIAPSSVLLAGHVDPDIAADGFRRLRSMTTGRLPNRSVEPDSPQLGPDGNLIELARVWGIVVDAAIADDLEAMLTGAFLDGVELSGWGMRSNAQQIELRRAHCGTSDYEIYEAPPSSCSPPTARPGRSRHEFGRAVDFTQGGAVLTRQSTGYKWLTQHAAEFGFFNLPSEPWHWSDTGG